MTRPYKRGNLKETFKNAEKSTPMILCLNAGSVAKLVVGGNKFQTLTRRDRIESKWVTAHLIKLLWVPSPPLSLYYNVPWQHQRLVQHCQHLKIPNTESWSLQSCCTAEEKTGNAENGKCEKYGDVTRTRHWETAFQLTDTGGIDVQGIGVEGVSGLAHSRSACDWSSDSSTGHTVCATT